MVPPFKTILNSCVFHTLLDYAPLTVFLLTCPGCMVFAEGWFSNKSLLCQGSRAKSTCSNPLVCLDLDFFRLRGSLFFSSSGAVILEEAREFLNLDNLWT